jgi:hypothetical protein
MEVKSSYFDTLILVIIKQIVYLFEQFLAVKDYRIRTTRNTDTENLLYIYFLMIKRNKAYI